MLVERNRLPQDLADNLRVFSAEYLDKLKELGATNQHAIQIRKQYDGSFESLQPIISATEAVQLAFEEEQLALARKRKFLAYCAAQQELARQMF